MLSSEELADLRADMETLLDLTADLQRSTSSMMDLGQPTETWTTIASGVKCGMMQPSRALAQQYASLLGIQQAVVFSFPDGQDVKRGDRVIVSGTTWTVQAPLTPQSYSVASQALATRIS